MPFPGRAAATWLPPVAGVWEWSPALPSLLSFSEKPGCRGCLCRLYTAQESSADRATGRRNTGHTPLTKRWARTRDLGSRGGLPKVSVPTHLLQPTFVWCTVIQGDPGMETPAPIV